MYVADAKAERRRRCILESYADAIISSALSHGRQAEAVSPPHLVVWTTCPGRVVCGIFGGHELRSLIMNHLGVEPGRRESLVIDRDAACRSHTSQCIVSLRQSSRCLASSSYCALQSLLSNFNRKHVCHSQRSSDSRSRYMESLV